MSASSGAARGGVGHGRLDPTVRGLLRVFLSPAVADQFASALQPIAVADRDAAISGAVSVLRGRFFVLPEEIAVALVEDVGWSVADVTTMLGLTTLAVRTALREAAAEAPRIGASPPSDPGTTDDAAAVAAMLADLPVHRRDVADGAAEAAAAQAADPMDVELATSVPPELGDESLERRRRRADRLQRIVVYGAVAATLTLAALAVGATRTPTSDGPIPDEEVVDLGPTPTPSPTPAPSPTGPTPTEPSPTADAGASDLPEGPVTFAEVRFTDTVDPATGEPGPALEQIAIGQDPRAWVRLTQLPPGQSVIEFRFTAPSGRATVRPVLLVDRTPIVSVRLPDELGREPGRYTVRVDAGSAEPQTAAVELVEPTG